VYAVYRPEKLRARVILELGYFMGKLGREKVCCLYTGNIDLPSDMLGIVYVEFNESIKEQRTMIIKELSSAGYNVS
jgi:predicted nucleotide-binding protein